MIENGYVTRVSRGLKAEGRNFNHSERAKSEFRGGDSMYRFDTVGISPFQVRGLRRATRMGATQEK